MRCTLCLQVYMLQNVHKLGKTHTDGDCLSPYHSEAKPVVAQTQQLNAVKMVEHLFCDTNMMYKQAKDKVVQFVIRDL